MPKSDATKANIMGNKSWLSKIVGWFGWEFKSKDRSYPFQGENSNQNASLTNTSLTDRNVIKAEQQDIRQSNKISSAETKKSFGKSEKKESQNAEIEFVKNLSEINSAIPIEEITETIQENQSPRKHPIYVNKLLHETSQITNVVKTATEELEKKRKKINQINSEIQATKNRLELTEKEIEETKPEIQNFTQKKKAKNPQLEKEKEELKKEKEELEKGEEELKKKKEALKKTEKTLGENRKALNKEKEELENEKIYFQNETQKLSTEALNLGKNLKNKNSLLNEKQTKLKRIQQEEQEQEQKLNLLKKKLEEKRQKSTNNEEKEKLKAEEKRLAETTKKIEALEQDTSYEKASKINEKISEIKEAIKNYENQIKTENDQNGLGILKKLKEDKEKLLKDFQKKEENPEYFQKKGSLISLKAQSSLSEENIQKFKKNVEELEKEEKEIEEQENKKKEQLVKTKKECEEAEKEYEKAEKEYEKAYAANESNKESLKQKKEKLNELNEKEKKYEKEKAKYEKAEKEYEERMCSLTDCTQQHNSRITKLQKQEKEIEEQEKKLEEKEKELEEKEKKLNNERSELTEKAKNLTKKEKELEEQEKEELKKQKNLCLETLKKLENKLQTSTKSAMMSQDIWAAKEAIKEIKCFAKKYQEEMQTEIEATVTSIETLLNSSDWKMLPFVEHYDKKRSIDFLKKSLEERKNDPLGKNIEKRARGKINTSAFPIKEPKSLEEKHFSEISEKIESLSETYERFRNDLTFLWESESLEKNKPQGNSYVPRDLSTPDELQKINEHIDDKQKIICALHTPFEPEPASYASAIRTASRKLEENILNTHSITKEDFLTNINAISDNFITVENKIRNSFSNKDKELEAKIDQMSNMLKKIKKQSQELCENIKNFNTELQKPNSSQRESNTTTSTAATNTSAISTARASASNETKEKQKATKKKTKTSQSYKDIENKFNKILSSVVETLQNKNSYEFQETFIQGQKCFQLKKKVFNDLLLTIDGLKIEILGNPDKLTADEATSLASLIETKTKDLQSSLETFTSGSHYFSANSQQPNAILQEFRNIKEVSSSNVQFLKKREEEKESLTLFRRISRIATEIKTAISNLITGSNKYHAVEDDNAFNEFNWNLPRDEDGTQYFSNELPPPGKNIRNIMHKNNATPSRPSPDLSKHSESDKEILQKQLNLIKNDPLVQEHILQQRILDAMKNEYEETNKK